MKFLRKRTTFKRVLYFIIFIIFSSTIASSLYIILNKKTTTVSNKYNSKWVNDSIKNRHVFIKEREVYISNGKEVEIINYNNSYFYDTNTLFLNVDIFNLKIKGATLKSRTLYFAKYNDCVNKKIDDVIWTKFSVTNSYLPFTNNALILIKVKTNYKINSLPFQVNSFFREEKNYNYLYTSYYIENNTIKHVMNKVTFRDKSIMKYTMDYNFGNGPTKIELDNVFKINSNSYIRNNGSISSLVIDEIGTIIGFQTEQNVENDIVFTGVKYG